MSPKEIAASFLKLAGGGNVREAYERFVAPGFIHHNQYFQGDRESLMKAMQEAHQKSPNKTVDVRKTYQDGDVVITQSLVTRQDPTQPSIAVVHIFRFKNDHIVELWDIGQPVLKDSPNQNGIF